MSRLGWGGLVIGLLWARAAAAAPHGTRLSYYGDPATTIAVSWNSDAVGDDQLIYGTSAAALTSTLQATRTAQPAPLSNSFTAKLTGLSPRTTYYYRVGNPGGSLRPPAGSPPFQFTTRSADPCAPFKFVLIGDNRADTDGVGAAALWKNILGEAMAHSPDFFVNTGDMVKNGERADEWVNFIDDSEVGWAYVPSLLTMGNHDEDQVIGDQAIYNQLYEHPRNSVTSTEDYYSLDVGPVHFASINTQFSNPAATDMTQMVSWLDADLAATSKIWKIVFFHKAIYSRGNHTTGEENAAALNKHLVPIFDNRDVDLVFNGHSHDYERYAPSVGVDTAFGGSGRNFPAGNGATFRGGGAVPDGTTGTTYMVSGGAGALTTEFMGFSCIDPVCTYCSGFNINCDAAVYNKDVAGTVVYDGRHNFAVFTVNGDLVTAEVWATAAGNSGGAQKLDSFTMTNATACGSPPLPDGGTALPDGATPDGASAAPDASGPAPDSASLAPDAAAPGGKSSSGCGCRTTGRGSSGALLLIVAAILAALFRSRDAQRS